MKNSHLLFSIFSQFSYLALFIVVPGCLSRAPTSYELDKRSSSGSLGQAGLPDTANSKDALQGARFSSQVEKETFQPVRVQALIEKIWVYDQQLGPAWLQGSWLYIEVQPAQWFDAIDPGSAPFVYSAPASLQGVPEVHLKTKKKKKR